jgi:hypothetical protein
MPRVVSDSSCGMYSSQRALGTAQVSATCNSIRKCGQTAMLKVSARCAVFSQGGNSTNARDIHLHDRAGILLKIFAKVQGTIEAFADCDRSASRPAESDVTVEIVGGKRLLHPANVERLVLAGSANRFIDVEGLIGVGENLKFFPDVHPYRSQSIDILLDRTTDLELCAGKAALFRLQGIFNKRSFL